MKPAKEFTCGVCNREFADSSGRSRHVLEQHGDENGQITYYSCRFGACKLRTPRWSNVTRHFRDVHPALNEFPDREAEERYKERYREMVQANGILESPTATWNRVNWLQHSGYVGALTLRIRNRQGENHMFSRSREWINFKSILS